jgi:hypothetical protein
MRASAKNPYFVLEIVTEQGEHEIYHSKQPIFPPGALVVHTDYQGKEIYGVVIKPRAWPSRGATVVTDYLVRQENGRVQSWPVCGLLACNTRSAA